MTNLPMNITLRAATLSDKNFAIALDLRLNEKENNISILTLL